MGAATLCVQAAGPKGLGDGVEAYAESHSAAIGIALAASQSGYPCQTVQLTALAARNENALEARDLQHVTARLVSTIAYSIHTLTEHIRECPGCCAGRKEPSSGLWHS